MCLPASQGCQVFCVINSSPFVNTIKNPKIKTHIIKIVILFLGKGSKRLDKRPRIEVPNRWQGFEEKTGRQSVNNTGRANHI